MGMYKYLRELWNRPRDASGYKDLIIELRREPATLRVERPTRLDRARSLGYRAKQGIVVVRQRVRSGGHATGKPAGGRKTRRATPRVALTKNHQQIAEERAGRKYPNCEVLNSYLLASDSKHHWYEVILIDRAHPAVKADAQLGPLTKQRGRAQRGLTSAARKSRGLRGKGKGYEKARPSKPAHGGRVN
ncbi:MAG: 50S ribosomal protein L15e [Candidatus Woesearchaeota archaeon]